jgi:hypothetical protein
MGISMNIHSVKELRIVRRNYDHVNTFNTVSISDGENEVSFFSEVGTDEQIKVHIEGSFEQIVFDKTPDTEDWKGRYERLRKVFNAEHSNLVGGSCDLWTHEECKIFSNAQSFYSGIKS